MTSLLNLRICQYKVCKESSLKVDRNLKNEDLCMTRELKGYTVWGPFLLGLAMQIYLPMRIDPHYPTYVGYS